MMTARWNEPPAPGFPGAGWLSYILAGARFPGCFTLAARVNLLMKATYFPTIISGVPVLVTPEEIDITTVEQLHAALRDATCGSHSVAVVDMSGTRFCDSSAVHALLRAHREARPGVELRLVVPADGPVPRGMRLLGVDQVIPSSPTLAEALGREASARPAAEDLAC